MPSDEIENLLHSDMNTLIATRRDDHFTSRIVAKIAVKRRRRTGAIMLAGGLGAAFAATQFASTVKAISPTIQHAAIKNAANTPAFGVAPELLATLMLAGALLITVMVVRHDV